LKKRRSRIEQLLSVLAERARENIESKFVAQTGDTNGGQQVVDRVGGENRETHPRVAIDRLGGVAHERPVELDRLNEAQAGLRQPCQGIQARANIRFRRRGPYLKAEIALACGLVHKMSIQRCSERGSRAWSAG